MGTGELSGKPEEMLGGGGGRLPINRLAPQLGGGGGEEGRILLVTSYNENQDKLQLYGSLSLSINSNTFAKIQCQFYQYWAAEPNFIYADK